MKPIQNYAVKAGILIGGAFLVVRLSMAKTLADVMLAVGATMIEIALVLFLERKAKELEPKILNWLLARAERRKAEEVLQAGVEDLKYRDELVKMAERERQETDEEREANTALCNADKISEIAVGASMAGYMQGLIERRRRIHGGLERPLRSKGAAA